MKIFLAIILFFIFLKADFTLVYRLDNNILQKVDYIDDKHVLITIDQNGNTIEKIFIKGDKKYVAFYKDGQEQIAEISDELSEPVEDKPISELDYTFIKKIKDVNISGIKAQQWLIKYGDSNNTTIVTVSNDKDIVEAIFNVMNSLRKILPANRQEEADMFYLGGGYVILETGNLKLVTYEKEKLALNILDFEDQLSNEEEEHYSKEIEKCFTTVCCGKKYIKAKEISQFLNNNINGWKLQQVARCDDPVDKGIESAVYKKDNQYVTVEITINNTPNSGKIDTLQKQGVKLQDIKVSKLKGFKMATAYLPNFDATVVDIMLPNTTISLYSKGKKELDKFANKILKFQLKGVLTTNSK